MITSNFQLVALQHQVQTRAEHTIKKLLPAMHGLALLIQETPLHHTADLDEFAGLLNTVHQGLQSALEIGQMGPGSVTPNHNMPTVTLPASSISNPLENARNSGMQTPPAKRQRLLPPSPEQKQRRKQSHAPL